MKITVGPYVSPNPNWFQELEPEELISPHRLYALCKTLRNRYLSGCNIEALAEENDLPIDIVEGIVLNKIESSNYYQFQLDFIDEHGHLP